MALGSDGVAPRAADELGSAVAGGPPSPAQAPEELVEIALRRILEETQTSAGAVCLFDQHQELLRLAVEVGLSDEGCRRLRSVRRGAATTWDMPLHSLLNKRVYLIESAAKNRYVPPLVDDVANVRAVACVPLYDGSTPVGSLILVAMAPRSFGERQIRLLEQPVRDLVVHIGAMRKRVSVAVPARSGRPSLSATATGAQNAVATAGPTQPGPKIAPGSGPAAPSSSSSIQAAVDRARIELDRLRGRLAEADEATATERKRAEALEQAQQALRAELVAATERATALDTALDEARRSEASLRADLDQALSAAAAEAGKATEAITARLAEVEAANTQLRARVDELEPARAEAERQFTRAMADAEAAREIAASAESRAAALASECDALQVRAAAADTALAEAQETAAANEATARAEHETAVAEWQRRCDALESELATTRSSAGSHGEQLDALAQNRAAIETELADAREREAALAARVEELEAHLARAQDEDVQLRDGFAHLESLIQTGVDSTGPGATLVVPDGAQTFAVSDGTDAGTAGDGATSFEVIELDAADDADDDAGAVPSDGEALIIEEVDATPPAEPPPAEPPAPSAAPPPDAPAATPEGVLVIDVDACWMQTRGTDVSILAPDAPPPVTPPERIIVNLAAPGALRAFATLRAAGIAAPAFGCIAIAGQARGLLVGRLELASRPIDPDALLSSLQGTFARGTRVVTAGADVDALISLRQALARLGVSVSMAWDAKQAGDLLSMVHPEVAIIDLDLPPKDGCALVARLGLVQPAPLTVVIPKDSDTAAGFAAALAHPEVGRMLVPAQELLARVLAAPLKVAATRR